MPQSVLMAVSYRQTRWETHDGLPSTTGLNASGNPEIEKTFDAAKMLRSLPEETVDTDDPRLHTLDKAAELIDGSADSVKNGTAESIRAGAALLAEYQRQATGELPDDPGQWYPGVARFSESPDKKGADSLREARLRVDQDRRAGAHRGWPARHAAGRSLGGAGPVERPARRDLREHDGGSDARVPVGPELQLHPGRGTEHRPAQLHARGPPRRRVRHPPDRHPRHRGQLRRHHRRLPELRGQGKRGVLWLYKGTGSATAPFAAREQIATGWQIYNLLV